MIKEKTEKPRKTRGVDNLELFRFGSNIVYLGKGIYKGRNGSFRGRIPASEKVFGSSQN